MQCLQCVAKGKRPWCIVVGIVLYGTGVTVFIQEAGKDAKSIARQVLGYMPAGHHVSMPAASSTAWALAPVSPLTVMYGLWLHAQTFFFPYGAPLCFWGTGSHTLYTSNFQPCHTPDLIKTTLFVNRRRCLLFHKSIRTLHDGDFMTS